MNELLVVAMVWLCGFLVGFLLARNTWLTFEGRQMRRDMRTILNLRFELDKLSVAIAAHKKRYAALLGNYRAYRRTVRQANEALKQIGERVGALLASPPVFDFEKHFREGAVPGMNCVKPGCDQPGEVRLGDSHYCRMHSRAPGFVRMPEDVKCVECPKPATTRIGDALLCEEHVSLAREESAR